MGEAIHDDRVPVEGVSLSVPGWVPALAEEPVREQVLLEGLAGDGGGCGKEGLCLHRSACVYA